MLGHYGQLDDLTRLLVEQKSKGKTLGRMKSKSQMITESPLQQVDQYSHVKKDKMDANK